MKKGLKKVLAAIVIICISVTFMPEQTALAATSQVLSNLTVSSDNIYDDEVVTVDMEIQGVPAQVSTQVPNDVILLLDCSGSMSSYSFFSAMQKASNDFLDIIDFSAHRVGIVAYASGAQSCELTDDKDELKSFISSLSASGSTATHLGINEAVKLLADKRSEATPTIVLLTDGYPDSRPSALSAATTAKEAGITFFTVALLQKGVDPETSVPNIELKKLATAGGLHHIVLGADGLAAVYQEIAKQIGEANAKNVVIKQQIGEGFEYVDDSAQGMPAPTVSGDTLTWEMQEIGRDTFHLSYQIKVKEGTVSGIYAHSAVGKITYTTYDGVKKNIGIAPIQITVNNYPPVIDSISKTDFSIDGGDAIVIKGENINSGVKVRVGTSVVSNVVIKDSETIEFTMPAHEQGTVDVSVANKTGDKATIPVRFMATPVVEKISPVTGAYEGRTQVKMAGRYIMAEAKVMFDGVEAELVTWTTDSIKVRAPFLGKEGTVDIVIVNPDGTQISMNDAYTYEPQVLPPAPTLTKLSKTSGTVGIATTIKIYGSDIRNGGSFKVTLGGEECKFVSLASDGVTVKVPTTLPAGTYDVVVTNDDGTQGSLLGAYTYEDAPAAPAPTLTKLSKTSGTVGIATTIKIYGSDIRNGGGFKVTLGGEECKFVSLASDGVKVKVPTTLPAGTYDVVVINDDGTQGSLLGAYTYEDAPAAPAPTLTKLSKTSGEVGVATSIKIYGSNIRIGGNFKVTLGGEECKFVYWESIGVKVKVPTTLPAGTYDIVVTNDDGTIGILSNAYTYQ